ncbi:hypothetical protein K7X08_030290 [Anisodus acutangulus]|uniref:HMA domain-containing protein n=1 Tax=Anisodus acutangulus TaxID=402998 RepID=A0A9Q1R579_9SOLA|nr:hypothetical protein K7X08_030290 [Anisodus acutangulus]
MDLEEGISLWCISIEKRVSGLFLKKRKNKKVYTYLLVEISKTMSHPFNTFALKLKVHCKDCGKKLEKQLLKFKGVRSVKIDQKLGKVVISGEVDPAKILSKFEKCGREAELWPCEQLKVNDPLNDSDIMAQLDQLSDIQGLHTVECFHMVVVMVVVDFVLLLRHAVVAIMVCWEKLTRCFEVELKDEYYVMDPVKAVEMIDENTVLIEKVLKVEPDGVTRPRFSERAVQRTSSAHEINLPSHLHSRRLRHCNRCDVLAMMMVAPDNNRMAKEGPMQ